MAKENLFVGGGKVKNFDGGGAVINCSLALEKVINLQGLLDAGMSMEQIFTVPVCAVDISKKGEHFLPFSVSERRHESQWGETHTVYVDEYYLKRSPKPAAAPAAAPAATAEEEDPFGDDDDDIPF